MNKVTSILFLNVYQKRYIFIEYSCPQHLHNPFLQNGWTHNTIMGHCTGLWVQPGMACHYEQMWAFIMRSCTNWTWSISPCHINHLHMWHFIDNSEGLVGQYPMIHLCFLHIRQTQWVGGFMAVTGWCGAAALTHSVPGTVSWGRSTKHAPYLRSAFLLTARTCFSKDESHTLAGWLVKNGVFCVVGTTLKGHCREFVVPWCSSVA